MPIIVDPSYEPPPPPEVIVSPDGYLTVRIDPTGAGVLLEADFSSLDGIVDAVRFLRDGVPVASGHDAIAVANQAIAYDRFAPFGVACQWTAIPIFRNGTEGEPTAAASGSVSDAGCNTWVKSVENPSASLDLIAIEPLPVFTKTARSQLSPIMNTKNRSGSWDVHLGWDTALSFMTQDATTQQQVEELLTSGPVLLQMPRRFNIEEMFCAVGDLEMAPFRNMVSNQHVFTVPLSQIATPPTRDAPLYIPGRSYGDNAALTADYAERFAMWPTYRDTLGIPS